MKKKKPDLVVWDEERGWYAKSLPYASNVGAPPIKPDNINSWKLSNVSKANKYFETRFNELLSELKSLKEEYDWTDLIYSAKFSFEPIIGEVYYLYENDKEYFLSIISPNEWNNDELFFVGGFRFDSKNKWTKVS